MRKRRLKPLLCFLLVMVVCFGSVLASGIFSSAEEEPIMRIVMMADLHVEYGLQELASPIRPSTAAAVTYVRKITNRQGVDVVLVGGDMSGPRGSWRQEQIPITQASVYDYMSDMTIDGKVMLVTGNHDPEPSVKVDSTSEDIYSGDYSSLMLKNCGEFVSALYVNDIDENLSPFNELLCYRYTVKGIEFLGLNTPYVTSQAKVCGFYAEQTKWLLAELEKIGKDKTVFLSCHYPPGSVSTISDPSTYTTNTCYQDLNKIFKEYPKLIYCYGHVHSGDSNWAKTDTFEMVHVGATTTKVEEGVFDSPSYISAHMGSMGYYNNVYQPGGLTVEDPMVVQFMMVELYADRIVFQIHNVGEKIPPNGTEDVKSMTIVRDLSAQFGLDPAEGVYGADGGEDSDGSSGFPWLLVLIALPVAAGVGAVAFFLYKKRQAEYYE